MVKTERAERYEISTGISKKSLESIMNLGVRGSINTMRENQPKDIVFQHVLKDEVEGSDLQKDKSVWITTEEPTEKLCTRVS